MTTDEYLRRKREILKEKRKLSAKLRELEDKETMLDIAQSLRDNEDFSKAMALAEPEERDQWDPEHLEMWRRYGDEVGPAVASEILGLSREIDRKGNRLSKRAQYERLRSWLAEGVLSVGPSNGPGKCWYDTRSVIDLSIEGLEAVRERLRRDAQA